MSRLNSVVPVSTTAILTSNYTSATGEVVRCDASAGSFTVTLPSAWAAGATVTVKLVATSGSYTVTVARSGSDLIDGATTKVLTLTGQVATFVASGAGVWSSTSETPLAALDTRLAAATHEVRHRPGGADALTNLTAASFAAGSVDGTAGTASLRTLGTGASQSAAGNHGHVFTVVDLGNDVVIATNNGAPTNAVAGTGYGVSTANDLYIQTGGGPIVHKMTGTTLVPAWTLQAGQPAVSGAGAPTDGVTDGATNDLYSDTTAYGGGATPTAGWYRCTDGTANTWTGVGESITSGAGAPTDGVVGTGIGVTGKGSLLLDYSTPKLFQNGGTKALPTWTEK